MARAFVMGYRETDFADSVLHLEVRVIYFGPDVPAGIDLSSFVVDLDLGSVLTAAAIQAAIAAGVQTEADRIGWVLAGAPGVKMILPAFAVG